MQVNPEQRHIALCYFLVGKYYKTLEEVPDKNLHCPYMLYAAGPILIFTYDRETFDSWPVQQISFYDFKNKYIENLNPVSNEKV
jgi:hypothetical protein